MALGELAAVGAVQQRQVRVARVLVAEGVEDEQLLGRVGEVVVAADHVGDPHLGVVDGDREVVEDAAVAAGDDEVVVAAVGEGDRAADQVLDHGLAVVGDPQPDRRALVLDRLAAVAAVGAVLGLPGLDLLGGRRVAVGGAGLEQPAPARPRGSRSARPARPGSRPSRARASAARRGSGRRSPRSSARGRCPRSAGPARRRRGGRRASCRAPCGRRRCGGRRSARGRTGGGCRSLTGRVYDPARLAALRA